MMLLEITYTTGKSWVTTTSYVSDYKDAEDRAIQRVVEMLERHPYIKLTGCKYRIIDFRSSHQLSWQILDLDKIPLKYQ